MLTKEAKEKIVNQLKKYKETLANRKIPNSKFFAFVVFKDGFDYMDSDEYSITGFLPKIESEQMIPDFHINFIPSDFYRFYNTSDFTNLLKATQELQYLMNDNDCLDRALAEKTFVNYLKIELTHTHKSGSNIEPEDLRIYSYETCFACSKGEDGFYFKPDTYLDMFEGRRTFEDACNDVEEIDTEILNHLIDMDNIYFWHNLEQPIDIEIKELQNRILRENEEDYEDDE